MGISSQGPKQKTAVAESNKGKEMALIKLTIDTWTVGARRIKEAVVGKCSKETIMPKRRPVNQLKARKGVGSLRKIESLPERKNNSMP